MKISKITLGTVQLGLDYSIHSNKPSLSQSYDILNTAKEMGVNVLDTARIYGDSEETIGSFLKNNSGLNIVSKFKVDPEKLNDPKDAFDVAMDSVEKSLMALGVNQIPILLFHKGPEHSLSQTCKVIPGILSKLKKMGIIGMGGVSVFEPSEIIPLSDFDEIEAFQVPVNILDHRLLHEDIIGLIKSKNKIIFARSIFLKGLLFKQPEMLAGKMDNAIPYIAKLHSLARKYNLSIAELAFLFVRDVQEITSLVIGADSSEQVRQNAELLNKPKLPNSLISEIQKYFASTPREVITPHVWNL